MVSHRRISLCSPRCILVALLLMALSAGCADSPSWPWSPSREGTATTSLPTTRQQAQDTVFEYYQKTLRELPEGYTLDGSRYGNAPSLIVCDDNAGDGMHAPAAVNDWRDLHTPPGTDYPALIAQIGDIWRGWGWRVTERDGFDKPNRFGYAPDGYWLNVVSAGDYFPSFGGGSPCFPGDESRFQPIPAPWVITRDNLQYEKPPPTR